MMKTRRRTNAITVHRAGQASFMAIIYNRLWRQVQITGSVIHAGSEAQAEEADVAAGGSGVTAVEDDFIGHAGAQEKEKTAVGNGRAHSHLKISHRESLVGGGGSSQGLAGNQLGRCRGGPCFHGGLQVFL